MRPVTWVSVRIKFYAALGLVILMLAVASIAILLLQFEAKVSYERQRCIQAFRRTPRGRHRRPKYQRIEITS